MPTGTTIISLNTSLMTKRKSSSSVATTNPVKSKILELFSGMDDHPTNWVDLSNSCGGCIATCHKYLRELINEGKVAVDADSFWLSIPTLDILNEVKLTSYSVVLDENVVSETKIQNHVRSIAQSGILGEKYKAAPVMSVLDEMVNICRTWKKQKTDLLCENARLSEQLQQQQQQQQQQQHQLSNELTNAALDLDDLFLVNE